jgi:hypothetical protein
MGLGTRFCEQFDDVRDLSGGRVVPHDDKHSIHPFGTRLRA